METKEQIVQQVKQYTKRFPEEQERSAALIEFVNAFDGGELISRKNFTGHITASAFIVDNRASALLLLEHRSLARWLQPGGHVDNTDSSLADAARREAAEETGLSKEFLELVSAEIFDVDSHPIPENVRKQEPAHVHHDVRFLFRCIASKEINISLEESTASRWVPFPELTDNKDFYWFEKKLKNLL